MAETTIEKPVVASDEHPQPELATGSSSPPATPPVTPPATTPTDAVSSRSPSPPTPDEITVEPTQTAPRESPVDPRVVALRALFPDYDDTILLSVLESVAWNQDRAVDTLLIMSDPDYKPEPALPQRPQRRHTAPTLTQEQLDEQFARQLLIQEEHQMSGWAAGRTQGPPPPPGPPGTYPAWGHPGYPGGPPAPHPQQQASQGQGMAEFQEQFNKFAETGKKTIGSFLTKVKTKFQEFEQGRPSGPSNTADTQYPTQQWTPGPASYYGPPQSSPPAHGFQYAGQSPLTTAPPNSSSPPPVAQTSASAATSAKSPQSTFLPPLTSSAQPIDGGKLGLLPKVPVSLIRDDELTVAGKNIEAETSGASPTTAPPGTTPAKGYTIDDDDDGLEYAESPFDDHAHKK